MHALAACSKQPVWTLSHSQHPLLSLSQHRSSVETTLFSSLFLAKRPLSPNNVLPPEQLFMSETVDFCLESAIRRHRNGEPPRDKWLICLIEAALLGECTLLRATVVYLLT